jgi:DNA processing protein
MHSALSIISLLMLPGYGRKTVHKLLPRISYDVLSANDIVDLLQSHAQQIKGLKIPSIENAKTAYTDALDIIRRSEDYGITIHLYGDSGFPKRLNSIPDSPLVMYTKGNLLNTQSQRSLALIGTRKPKETTRKTSFVVGTRLAQQGITVVSGLAAGCDTEAHLGCLDAQGLTLAVLAHGLDTVSPTQNKELAHRIVAEGGCLVSEYPLGAPARRNHFVERDRLQSGLSDGVIVLECSVDSGSMHTVKYGEKQGRPVGAIVGKDAKGMGKQFSGNRMLIESGRATPLVDRESLNKFISVAEDYAKSGSPVDLEEKGQIGDLFD